MSLDGASMAYEMLQKLLFFVMQKLLKPVSRRASMSLHGASMAYEVANTIVFIMQKLLRPVTRRASMSLDGASMAYEMLQKHSFHNAKAVEACMEEGLNDPRWSLDGI